MPAITVDDTTRVRTRSTGGRLGAAPTQNGRRGARVAVLWGRRCPVRWTSRSPLDVERHAYWDRARRLGVRRRGGFAWRRSTSVALLAGLAVCSWALPAGADAAYHASHVPLHATGSAPLRSGFVPEHPCQRTDRVCTRELRRERCGSRTRRTRSCSPSGPPIPHARGTPTLQIPTAVLTTNGSGQLERLRRVPS